MVQSREPDRSICIYYYGMEHLNVNLNLILKKEREKNRKLMLFFGENLWKAMRLESLIFSENQAVFLHEAETPYLGKFPLEIGMSQETLVLLNTAQKGGYHGLTCLFDVKELIQKKSKQGYFKWQAEMAYTEYDFPYQKVFLFDAEDYLETQQYIDGDVITHSLSMTQYKVEQPLFHFPGNN